MSKTDSTVAQGRKKYLIIWDSGTGGYRVPCYTSTLYEAAKGAGVDQSFIEPIALRDLPHVLTNTFVGSYHSDSLAMVSRRRHARALQREMSRNKPGVTFTIVEVGEFKREVKAVASWKITREYRLKNDGGKPGKWDEKQLWAYGIELRSEARRRKEEFVREHNGRGAKGGVFEKYQFRFRVVPVYAEGKA